MINNKSNKYESIFDYQSLVEECIDNIEIININNSSKNDLL